MFHASGVGFVQRIAQIATTVVTLPLVLHALGVYGFGIWGAATSLAWLSGILDFGLGSALITLIPRTIATGQNELTREHVAAALICGCILSVIVVIAGAALTVAGTQLRQSTPFLLAVVGLALNVPLSIAGNVWFGLQKGHVAGGWEIVQTLLTLCLLLTAAAFHGGVTAMVCAVYAALVLTNFASLAHLLVRHPEIRPRRSYPSMQSLQIVVGQSGWLFLFSVAVACSYMFDNLLTLHWLGGEASAQMTMAMRLCTTAAGVIAVLTQPLWPAFVEAESVGDRPWALRTLSWGTVMVLVLAVSGAAVIVLFGAPLLTWWLRSNIGIGPALLWATGIWIVVICTPRVPSLLFSAALILRSQFIAATAALALAIALKCLLVDRFGVVGILSATPISWLIIMWPASIWLMLRWRDKPNSRTNAGRLEEG